MDDLHLAASWIAEAGRIVVLTGAGVSAESGILTFRGPGGLWRGLDAMSLATPEAFADDPRLVWEFYNWRRSIVAGAQPNTAHHALARLEARSPSFTLVTQNVDGLHRRAGSRNLLEIHGSIEQIRCIDCFETIDAAGIVLPELPRCDACGGLMRPAVVWFGESLPSDLWEIALEAVRESDLLLVVGTSALVHPAAGLIRKARSRVIEVNLEPTPASEASTLSLYGKAGEILPAIIGGHRCDG
jgi:NAD-dependent deacetylase